MLIFSVTDTSVESEHHECNIVFVVYTAVQGSYSQYITFISQMLWFNVMHKWGKFGVRKWAASTPGIYRCSSRVYIADHRLWSHDLLHMGTDPWTIAPHAPLIMTAADTIPVLILRQRRAMYCFQFFSNVHEVNEWFVDQQEEQTWSVLEKKLVNVSCGFLWSMLHITSQNIFTVFCHLT